MNIIHNYYSVQSARGLSMGEATLLLPKKIFNSLAVLTPDS